MLVDAYTLRSVANWTNTNVHNLLPYFLHELWLRRPTFAKREVNSHSFSEADKVFTEL